MEFVILIPIIVVVIWLREAGFSWTAIMMLWDVIICSLYWLIYVLDRRSEEKQVSRRDKIAFFAVFLLTLSSTPLILIHETGLTFCFSALLPLFTSSLWFIIKVLKED